MLRQGDSDKSQREPPVPGADGGYSFCPLLFYRANSLATHMGDPRFTYTIYLASTLEQVWDTLTDPKLSPQYFFGRRIESDWEVGGNITLFRENGDLDVEGTITAYVPQQRLAYTWTTPDDSYEREEVSEVTFELREVGKAVRVTLTHDNLIPEDFGTAKDGFRGLNNGWPAILSSLKSLVETGSGITYQ